jgi:hypothetical protein
MYGLLFVRFSYFASWMDFAKVIKYMFWIPQHIAFASLKLFDMYLLHPWNGGGNIITFPSGLDVVPLLS